MAAAGRGGSDCSGANQFTLGLAGLGIRRPLAVVRLRMGAMGLGHGRTISLIQRVFLESLKLSGLTRREKADPTGTSGAGDGAEFAATV
jgi:hypothetical protein